MKNMQSGVESWSISIPAGCGSIEGELHIPVGSRAGIVFAHGSGSSRHSPRNQYVAQILNSGGMSTLLVDLLTQREETVDRRTAQLRFDIELLAERLISATEWLQAHAAEIKHIGYFGASTGAAAALAAAARNPTIIDAIVSRGGRPDLAGEALTRVRAPTLLLVGEFDEAVMVLNRQAAAQLRILNRLEIIPRATHLFEEAGALEQVAYRARRWFEDHLIKE
jgi:dienelactone hydrolase